MRSKTPFVKTTILFEALSFERIALSSEIEIDELINFLLKPFQTVSLFQWEQSQLLHKQYRQHNLQGNKLHKYLHLQPARLSKLRLPYRLHRKHRQPFL